MSRGFSRFDVLIRTNLCAFLVTTVWAVNLGGCFEPASDPAGPEQIPLDDLSTALASLESAFNEKDLDAYAALLDEEFQFCVLPRDPGDFPWSQGECWDRATELVLFENRPHPIFGNDFDVMELSRTAIGGQELAVTCTVQNQVFTSEDQGWSFDRRLVFDFLKRDGSWKVSRITEMDE